MKGLYPISKTENIKQYKSIPCTDGGAIMKMQSLSWTELILIDGKEVIYEPCEEPISGIDLSYNKEGNTIDFRSESDPLKIISTSKLYNQITITYANSSGTKSSILIRNLEGGISKIGKGTSQDKDYVKKENENLFPLLKEDCN